MNVSALKILVVAGDYSGDIHAASLCRELHQFPGYAITIAALGGKHLQQEADYFLKDLVGMSVFGFIKPIFLIFRLRSILYTIIRQYLLTEKPDAVILVDYYGFNIHVARLAHRLSVPVMYFISPQIWATRSYRINRLKQLIKRMFVIFPFEQKIYNGAGIPVTYIGHPLIDRIPEPAVKKRLPDILHIGLLPGSRESEIKKHLPVLLKAAAQIKKRLDKVRFSLIVPLGMNNHIQRHGAGKDITEHISIIHDINFEVRKTLDFAISSSGTATLENALCGIPMIVIYKTSWPTYICAKLLIYVPYICIVNILLRKKLITELIQHHVTATAIAQKTVEILSDTKKYWEDRIELLSVRNMLGSPGAMVRASQIIVQELKGTA